MLSKVLSSAILALVLSASGLQAQTLANIGGPANLPPAAFSGQQFVDNRGCLFLRAGFGGAVNWVPRVDAARRPVCGMVPTFAAVVAEAEVPPAEPVVTAEPPARVARAVAPAKPSLAAALPPALANAIPKPPRGYELAWTDDRLNPLRGVGTAEGQAQQDRLWTREVPARLVADTTLR